MTRLLVVSVIALALAGACGQAKHETKTQTELRPGATTVGPGPAAEIR